MKLYIDTTNSETVKIALDEMVFTAESKIQKSQMLLPFIETVLKENNLTLKDITEIEVNTGPGSFTGIRVGVSIAQTLAWSLNIPLNGKDIIKESLDISYE